MDYITKENIDQIELDNKIIIFYRESCPDCRAVKKELFKTFGQRKGTYIIDTRSEIGKELVDEYNIISVPRAILIDKDNKQNTINYDLFIKEGKKFNKELADKLIKEQERRKNE